MKIPSAYAAHDSLAAPARKRPEGWRFALGMVVIMVAGYGIMSTYWALIQTIAGAQAPAVVNDAETGSSPIGMILLLIGFGSMAGGVALAAEHVHKRAFLSLIGPLDLAWSQFKRVILPVAGITALVAILPFPGEGRALENNLPLGYWIALLPLSIFALGVQVVTEELLFRGYLQQHLSAISRDPRLWIGLPSALFALGHYMPAETGANAIPLALWAGAFGIAMGDLTARAGTLAPAIAVHFVNNAAAILLVSYQGDLSGLALYTLPVSVADVEPVRAALPVDILLLVVTWLAARVALRR